MTGNVAIQDKPQAGQPLDRTCPPDATVERLRPHFPALGISRVARQTNLDRIGIPCFAAIRPNSRSLAIHQGKGLTDAAAMASAIMEAAEVAIAESPPPAAVTGTAAELDRPGRTCFDPSALLPFGTRFDRTATVSWLAGTTVFSRRSALVPRDLVRMDGVAGELPGVCQNTTGLAAGNTLEEATLHGLCELIERDATTLWTLRSDEGQLSRCIGETDFDDDRVRSLIDKVRGAGFLLRLFDLTSDIGVPTVMAVLGLPDPARLHELAAGYGTHPIAAVAAIRAITEAAQSRITLIAGARDDMDAPGYRELAAEHNIRLLKAEATLPPPGGIANGASIPQLSAAIEDALAVAGVDEPVAVPLGGDAFGIAVVRVLSAQLEDREGNMNWRPGLRSIRLLTGSP